MNKGLELFPETNGKKSVGITTSFSETWGLQSVAAIGYEKGEHTTGGAGNNAVIWNHSENKLVDYFLNPESVESIRWFNTLCREGVLNPESFTDMYTQTTEKTNSG